MEVCKKMTNALDVGTGGARDEFKETELCLGLPGGGVGGEGEILKSSGKRGFAETVDLKLELKSKDSEASAESDEKIKSSEKAKSLLTSTNDPARPPAAKAQVVGWPPVRSYRKNILSVQKNNSADPEDEKKKVNNNNSSSGSSGCSAAFVKVSMDGAPYLRKVDLKMYKSYQELSDALGKMFSSFTIGNCGAHGMLDFMNESKLMDLLNGSEYQPTYEDKDGDWMLVGDVPWEMFVDSCKRLRIMKGSEAIGLAPRAVEKCKNRS
ncbi:hypothetical protein Sjap_006411 [Stephania japonica]|uniref:Auxin-responsive protein n=1 Tax=Stephania japonica TaxID=461633 RepID=A0AAP0K7C1_9MAGN